MNTDYEQLKARGICPRCRKNKVGPKFVHCKECRVKLCQYAAKRYIKVGNHKIVD